MILKWLYSEKKDNVQTDSFHLSVRIQSLQADKTVQWKQNWLTQRVFHRAHTYRRRSSAVEYSRCLVNFLELDKNDKNIPGIWSCALNQVQGAVCSWY